MSLNEVSIKIPGEYIPNVFGQFDAFAKKIERTLHVTLVLRDDSLKIIGAQGNIDGAKESGTLCLKETVSRMMSRSSPLWRVKM